MNVTMAKLNRGHINVDCVRVSKQRDLRWYDASDLLGMIEKQRFGVPTRLQKRLEVTIIIRCTGLQRARNLLS